MFDKISHTTVSSNAHGVKVIVPEIGHSALLMLHDTDGSNNEEDENSYDDVALFEKSPLWFIGFSYLPRNCAIECKCTTR